MRWIAAVLVVMGLIGVSAGTPRQSEARPASFSCAGEPVSNYDAPGQRITVLKGCVIVTGSVSRIVTEGSFVQFALRPDRAYRYLLNAHNIAEGGYILVLLQGRAKIHGKLYNNERVQVASPWVHDVSNGPNYLAAPQYVKVLPFAFLLPKPKPATTPAPTAAPFTVRAVVSPSVMGYGEHPILIAYTNAGAICTAGVVYFDTNRPPTSFHGYPQTVGSSGSVSWPWHEETKGSGGTATVDCTLGGKTVEAQATFTVTH